MSRKLWIFAILFVVVAAVGGTALAMQSGGEDEFALVEAEAEAKLAAARERAEAREMEAAADATADEPMEAPTLVRGERFDGPAWSLEVRDAFVVDSPHRPGHSAVRATVVYTPLADTGDAYGVFSLTGLRGFPSLVIRDASDAVYEIPAERPGENLVPGSALLSIEPGVPALWTVGFEVPNEFTSALTIEAMVEDRLIARWDILADAAAPVGYGAPDGIDTIAPGEVFDWTQHIEVAATDLTTLYCGADDSHRTMIFALEVEVTNNGEADAYFPNVRFPDTAAIAVWADGASARYSDEAGLISDEPLEDRNEEQTIVPPGVTATRVMEFFLPRDTRFGDALAPPAGVLLTPNPDTMLWLDLEHLHPTGALVRLDACENIAGGPEFAVDRTGILIDSRDEPVPVAGADTDQDAAQEDSSDDDQSDPDGSDTASSDGDTSDGDTSDDDTSDDDTSDDDNSDGGNV